jgi:hypothetical protein
LLNDDEVGRTGAEPWTWGFTEPAVQALVTQTADPRWNELDVAWFPTLRAVIDGRNSLGGLSLAEGVTRRGIGKR